MNDETIKACARALVGQIIEIRRHLHAHPELSFHEHETANYLADRLTEAGITFQRIAGTGILARITGTGDPKRCVVLRADTDALPIQEESGVPFTSVNAGVMHACGHDIHTSCLLGALLVLQQHRELIEGTVFGLFQPGEEIAPGGAASVLEEGPFRDYSVMAFVGEHVAPEMLSGHLGFRSGQYMASSDELHIKVHGTGGHGALPHTLTDPVVASAALITALQQIILPMERPTSFHPSSRSPARSGPWTKRGESRPKRGSARLPRASALLTESTPNSIFRRDTRVSSTMRNWRLADGQSPHGYGEKKISKSWP